MQNKKLQASCYMHTLAGKNAKMETKEALCPSSMVDSWLYDIPYTHGIQLPVQASVARGISGSSGNGEIFQALALGPYFKDNILELDMPLIHGIQRPEQASTAAGTNDNSEDNGSFHLKLQEANNISKAAYKEIITKAIELKTWVVASPALGSIEEFMQMFQTPPPSGMRVEYSIESAVIPIAPDILVSVMMDVDRWASILSQIVYRGSSHDPTGVLEQLISMNEAILKVKMVNAEVRLPTPFVKTRKFCFLRCQIQIIPNIWAIVDVSNDYFQHTPDDSKMEQTCRRRPSGVIIRRHDNYSEVIWIENVEVHQCQFEDNIYYTLINSNLAFCAKRWVSTLLSMLKRKNSSHFNAKMRVDRQGHTSLMKLIKSMEMLYSECVNEAPDEEKWVILSDQGVRILRDIMVNHVDMVASNNYMALTSFCVQAKPVKVFDFLVKKSLELQWPSLLKLEEPEEVIKLATNDNSNCITLYKKLISGGGLNKKLISQNESTKVHEYLLQQASWNEFCSYIISAPMSQLDVNASLFHGRWRDVSLQPSGFAIMPDGSAGLQSNASLVTIVMQQQLDVPETNEAIKVMSNLIGAIIGEIEEEGKFLLNTKIRENS